MNCPSRNDDSGRPDWNQSPPAFTADTTTREDLNGIANAREQREHSWGGDPLDETTTVTQPHSDGRIEQEKVRPKEQTSKMPAQRPLDRSTHFKNVTQRKVAHFWQEVIRVLVRYAHFIGPGFLISVAYIDPGNYATDVAAGADTRFSLLFIVLMSNLFAIFLQSLCIKLGSVTGLNLAENCRAHLPTWVTIILYLFSEAAIIATDIAEVSYSYTCPMSLTNPTQVIGSAIALNLLFHIPLVAGCAITLVDVLIILFFYNPNGTMTKLRLFEFFVMLLVLGVVICFCIQLSFIKNTTTGEIFLGYLPSSAVVQGNGIYLSCGILGATVMPHSVFLGSGVVQSRLRQFDQDAARMRGDNNLPLNDDPSPSPTTEAYRPSIYAIRSCLKYSIVELATSLFSFALFVNSAILIVAGASLFNNPDAGDADLFGIHALLSRSLSPAAGAIFAVALLLSGTSAGIVCTMAGQMVSEGMLNWTIAPWLRRLVTRAISIIPSIIIAAAVGQEGLNAALTASQVVLSVILPFVTAPLIYFTCRTRVMTVPIQRHEVTQQEGADVDGVSVEDAQGGSSGVSMRNGILVTVVAVLIWLVLVVMNIALLVLVGLGKA
ncbi:MAG: hypothetical protein Q9160_006785 [Pyrenula sp. 1 TL-2023]